MTPFFPLRGTRATVALASALLILVAMLVAGRPADARAATRLDCVISPSLTITETATSREVVATFSIRNVAGCTDAVVTLAGYQKPGPGFVLPQLLTATATGIFDPGGPYTLTIQVPTCGFFQFDLVEGLAPNQLPNPLTAGNISSVRPHVRIARIDDKACAAPQTPGFWKNHASCSASDGTQAFVLDRTLALAGGIQIGDLLVDTCVEAVRLLNKSTVNTNVQKASHPAYNLAAHLLAARLNLVSGAVTCPSVVNAVNSAQALLDAINFTGTGSPPMTAQQVSQANSLATLLDNYNNGLVC